MAGKECRLMKKKRLFILFLISYILVALLPMITLVNLYYLEASRYNDETLLKEAQSSTATTMAVLDSHLSIIGNLPRQLFDDRDVLAYKNTGDTLKRGDVIDLLQQIIGANELIEDIYLYFRQPKTFVSAYCNSYDAQTMRLYGKDRALYYEALDYDALFHMLDTQYAAEIMPSQLVRIGAQSAQPVITFVETLPQHNKYAYATMLTLVNTKKLDKILANGSNLGYMLFDATGSLVVDQTMPGLDAAALLQTAQAATTGAQHMMVSGQDSLMVWNRSSSSGWTIIQFHPADILLERMYSLQSKTLMIVSLLSMVMFALIFVFMRKTYKPVGNLYAVANDMNGGDETSNAFEFIERTMNTLHSKNTELLNQLTHQSGYMVERTASRLLHKPQSDWAPRHYEEGRRNGLDMNREVYQVLILHYQDAANMQSAIELAEQCCGDEFICSIIEEIYDQLILILGGRRGELSLFDRLDLTSLAADIIAVGSEVDSPSRWNESYTEAMMISNHAMLHNDGKCVFRKSDLPQTIFIYDETHWSAIHYLTMASYQSDPNTLRTAQNRACAYLLQDTTNFVEAKMVVCQILSSLKDKLPDSQAELERDVMRIYMSRAGIDAREMTDILCKYVDAFSLQIEKRRVDEGNPLLERSLQFINDNIGSHDLSLAVVAEYVGLSASRYSTLFSQYMSCNYKTYIDNLRIERAKRMLEDTTLMISEIAEAVGYDSSYSFARLFKKKVGMPPNEYRAQLD